MAIYFLHPYVHSETRFRVFTFEGSFFFACLHLTFALLSIHYVLSMTIFDVTHKLALAGTQLSTLRLRLLLKSGEKANALIGITSTLQ